MGSVMLMRCSSTRLTSWPCARPGMSPRIVASRSLVRAEAELAVDAAGAAGDRATIAHARSGGIARHRSAACAARPRARRPSTSGLRMISLQLGTLGGVLLHELLAALLALDHAGLRHVFLSYLRNGKLKDSSSARPSLSSRARRRDRDVHAADRVDLVVGDFREDDLFLDAERVVAAAVERAGRHAAEVADARHRHVDQAIEEFVHARAAQRDLGADGHALAQLERRDRLARLRHHAASGR